MDTEFPKGIELNGQLTNGELVSLQLEQTFGDWDGDVEITEPEELLVGYEGDSTAAQPAPGHNKGIR